MSQTKPKQQNQPSEPQRHAGSAQHEAQKPIAPEQHAPLPQHKLKNIGANVVDTGVAGQKAFVGGATSEGEPKAKPAHTESKPKGDQRQQKATPTSEHAESEEPKDSQPPRQTPPSGAKGKGSGQPQQQQQQPPSAAPKGAAQQPMEQATKASPKMTAAPAKSAAAGTKKETSPKPPTQHLHKKGHGKEHAFGGHSIPRADSDDCDPRDLYPKPPYDEQTQAAPAIEGKMKYLPDFGEYSYNGSGKLKDKVCLVTGGDSGIGRAVSVAFAREGADSVMIQYLPVEQADAQETERVVTTANCGFFGFACDLATEDACKQMVDAAVAKFGRIDVLVCNAAMQGKTVKSISEITGERVSKTFAVNVLSIFHTIRFALPHMKPGSCIITTSSIQATDPSCFIADYAATKAAVSNITSSMCRELLTKGIRINSVAPGPVWTPLIAQSFPKENLSKFGSGDLGQGVYGRPAQPCEMAPAFVFLACNTDSSYVNGSVIHVDGGSNS